MKPMSDNKYDFSKIHLTNGLSHSYVNRNTRRPVLAAVVIVVALGVGWYMI